MPPLRRAAPERMKLTYGSLAGGGFESHNLVAVDKPGSRRDGFIDLRGIRLIGRKRMIRERISKAGIKRERTRETAAERCGSSERS